MKVKLFGQTLTVREVQPTETITDRMIQTFGKPENAIDAQRFSWAKSTCVGEPVSDHPDRTYLEVLSKFFK